MARLKMKLGEEGECERLQHAVLHMRSSALGLHHEDTHRSAMDVYFRRRQVSRVSQALSAEHIYPGHVCACTRVLCVVCICYICTCMHVFAQ